MPLFSPLDSILARPRPFEFYTAADLWTGEHISARMLAHHLDEHTDLASHRAAFIDRSVEWLVGLLGIQPGTRLVDFGCGPGLYTSRLAQRGALVTAIDFSPRSIAYARDGARSRGLQIDYVQQNYLDFSTPRRFDLILMIFCDLCALSPAQRSIMLNKYRSLLAPGGRIVLDVHSLAAFDRRAEGSTCAWNLMDGFWSPEPYFGFRSTFKYDAEKVALDKFTIITADRTQTVYNWLQYFSVDSLAQEFGAAGLEFAGVFSDVAGTPFDPALGDIAVVARARA